MDILSRYTSTEIFIVVFFAVVYFFCLYPVSLRLFNVVFGPPYHPKDQGPDTESAVKHYYHDKERP